ncbi:hypothetical protein ACWGQ5_56460, partial [Streptomyces sp. NPDC055722]
MAKDKNSTVRRLGRAAMFSAVRGLASAAGAALLASLISYAILSWIEFPGSFSTVVGRRGRGGGIPRRV